MNEVKANDYCEKTVLLVKNLEEGFLVLGERLKKIRDEQLFSPVHESFREFLEECRMKEGTASKLISVYTVFIEGYGLEATAVAAVGWSALYESIPMINNKTEAKAMLHELTHRRDKDARDYIRELRSGVDQTKCSHEDSYTIKCCRTCGIKIRDEESK